MAVIQFSALFSELRVWAFQNEMKPALGMPPCATISRYRSLIPS